MRFFTSLSILFLSATTLLFLSGCGEGEDDPTPVPSTPTSEPQLVITLGDIDPDEPTKKIERFQPLADYLAQNLREFGIQEGRVIIARDIDEMAEFMKEGKVDLFFDSSFPVLAVQERADSDIILRRWKDKEPVYWSVFIAPMDSEIREDSDFLGKVIAFEEPHSTSGYVLPAGTLLERGFKLIEVTSPDQPIGTEEIGYLFSRDEENTFELVTQDRVVAGAVSNQDYDDLTTELKQKIQHFDRSITVPRQLVSARAGLSTSLQDEVIRLLKALDKTPEGRELLDGLKKTKTFDSLDEDSRAALKKLGEYISLVEGS